MLLLLLLLLLLSVVGDRHQQRPGRVLIVLQRPALGVAIQWTTELTNRLRAQPQPQTVLVL